MPNELYNNEAEQYLLAAILRNPRDYFDINDVGLIASDFANRDHIYIFRSIEAAVGEKSDPNLPYIIEHLKATGKAHVVDYVGGLTSVPCSVAQAHDYARVVKGLAISRELGNAGARIIEIAQEHRTDYQSALVESENILRSISDTLPEQERSPSVADILHRMEVSGPEDHIPLTFSHTLQSMTGGLSRGHFWVVGAFSSTGKSAFVSNLALDALHNGARHVAIVSAEMTQEQYMIRLLSIESGVPMSDIASRVTIGIDKHKNLISAKQRLSSYGLYVYDDMYRMAQIRSELQRIKNQKGLDVAVIDYIQNITVTGDEVSDAREVALECQRLAKDLSCTVIACSQISNEQARYEIEGGDENYFSLKGHGAIRDAADVILSLKRDSAHQSSILKVFMRKNRHGPRSNFECEFNLLTSKIEEIEWEDS